MVLLAIKDKNKINENLINKCDSFLVRFFHSILSI